MVPGVNGKIDPVKTTQLVSNGNRQTNAMKLHLLCKSHTWSKRGCTQLSKCESQNVHQKKKPKQSMSDLLEKWLARKPLRQT